MAIVIEEERRGIGFGRIAGWGVIFIIIAAAVYYVFFAAPATVEQFAPPANFQSIQPLSQIAVNPEDVTNNPVFQSLKQYVTPPPLPAAGRSNPFLAPSAPAAPKKK